MFEEIVKYSKLLLIIAFVIPIGIAIYKYKKYKKYREEYTYDISKEYQQEDFEIVENKNLLEEKND